MLEYWSQYNYLSRNVHLPDWYLAMNQTCTMSSRYHRADLWVLVRSLPSHLEIFGICGLDGNNTGVYIVLTGTSQRLLNGDRITFAPFANFLIHFYHLLRIQHPEAWLKIDDDQIKVDAQLDYSPCDRVHLALRVQSSENIYSVTDCVEPNFSNHSVPFENRENFR
jgi:hypothetical protein